MAVITPTLIADALVDLITGFAADVDGVPIAVNRIYHDDGKVKDSEIKISVFHTGQVRKSDGGQRLKTLEADFKIAIQLAVPKKDPARLDALVEYVAALDTHIEAEYTLEGAHYELVDDEDLDYWRPDHLHEKNTFTALIPLRYSWRTQRGTR